MPDDDGRVDASGQGVSIQTGLPPARNLLKSPAGNKKGLRKNWLRKDRRVRSDGPLLKLANGPMWKPDDPINWALD